MMRKINAVVLAAAAALAAGIGYAEEAKRPTIEAVFVLDTTGSMGGLLEGAKRKVWAIANEMAKGKPEPRIRIGLVAYRDKGDEYRTKVVDLTDDLDAVYARLLELQPGGGGDGPEDVKRGLLDAVEKVSWSKDAKALKIVYLVGDAPGHLEYDDTPALRDIVARAVKADIRINAIQCGSDPSTTSQWTEIARFGEGKSFAISQDGGVTVVATPFDADLAEWNRKAEGTLLAFGEAREEAKGWARKAAMLASAAAPEAAADRAVYGGRAGFRSGYDLIDALNAGTVRLESLKNEELPDEFKGKSAREREDILKARRAERELARKKVVELSKKREAFLKKEALKGGKGKDSFDAKVLEVLKEQAKAKGISY